MFNRSRKNHVVTDAQINLLMKDKLHSRHQQHNANVLVLDSAHSWIICFANFVLMTLDSAFVRAISMTFLNIVEDFQVTITEASVGFTLELVCFSLSSMLVTSLVVPKTGERIASIVGAVFGSMCTLGISLSPNIVCFLILMAFKGMSAGATVVASIALISQYFEKRKSFATAVACSGLALGSMGAPPVVKLLIEMYGRQGAFLLIGALEMNNICMTMLLRPTTRYTKIIHSGQDKRIKTSNKINVPDPKCQQETSDSMCMKQIKNSQISHTVVTEITSVVTKTNETEDDAHNFSLNMKCVHELKSDGENSFSSSSMGEPTEGIQNHQKDFGANANEMSLFISAKTNDRAQNIKNKSSDSFSITDFNISSFIDRASSYDSNNDQRDKLNFYETSNQQMDRLSSYDNSSLQKDNKHPQMGSKMSTLNVSSTWSVISTPVSDVLVGLDFCALQETNATCDKDQINTLNKSCFTKFIMWLHGAFNIHLFRTWSLRALLLYNMTGVLNAYLTTYFPTICAKSGLTNDEIALMLIISGGVDFVCRLAIGAFSDLHVLSNTQIVAIAQIIIGTASHFAHFYTSFEALMVLAVIIGVFGGVRQTFGTLICLQFMGAEMYVQALGFQTMTATLTMAVHHPLLSSILEVSGSFNPPLHYVGVAAYMSAIILLLEPYIKRMDADKETLKK